MKPFTHSIAFVALSACALGAATLVPASLAAQGAVTITGHVADTSGAPLPAAIIHVVGTQLGAAGSGDGAYTIANVPPGRYRVLAIARGYVTDTESVTITPGA